MYLAILAMFIGAVSSLSIPVNEHIHCYKNTCPPYVLVARHGDLELRCYRQSIWVSISGNGKLYGNSHRLPVWKLEQFLNGNNSKNSDVPIGTISTHLFDESRGVYTTEYFVPMSFRRRMPRPVDKDVRVIYRRSFCAYVYGFSGWLADYQIMPSYRTKTKNLIAEKFGLDNYYPDFFFYVTYRSGFQFIPQYNEIWYIIKFTDENGREPDDSTATNKTD